MVYAMKNKTFSMSNHPFQGPIVTAMSGQPDLVVRARVYSHETEVKSQLVQDIRRSEARGKLDVRYHKSDTRSQAESGCQEIKPWEQEAHSPE